MTRWSAAFALLLAACATDTRTVVTVYTPHGTELMADVKARFERLRPELDIQWVELGSQAILERVRAEHNAPKADVWFGAPSDLFDRAAVEGLLADYSPSWASAIPADAKDTAGFWYGTYLTPEVIGYNTAALKPGEAPRDWADLAEPRFKGRLVLRDPVPSGTMRAIFGAMLQRSMTQTGSTEAGWRWLERVDANVREYTASPTLLYQQLGRRDGVVTMYTMPDLATLQVRQNIPVKVVIPLSGTPLLVDGVAIVAGAPHGDAARAFVDFVTSRDILLVAARDHLRIPARNDIPADSLPRWIRDAQREIVPMAIDRRLMADSLASWMAQWDTRVRGHFKGK
ncbi:MAG: extracellular solute-binding protein [Gemmatimonadetes bacterium]|nr:extracellular solute-binding protein [Gemmatimonadota bacterium]